MFSQKSKQMENSKKNVKFVLSKHELHIMDGHNHLFC
jgi:hypothetical protein